MGNVCKTNKNTKDQGKHIPQKEHMHYGPQELVHAAERGHLDKVRRMIEYKENANYGHSEVCNAIYGASASGHLEVLRELITLNGGVNSLHKRRASCNTACPLWRASYSGYYEIVCELVDHGMHETRFDSALQVASEGGHFEIVWKLIESGADLKLCSKNQVEVFENSWWKGAAREELFSRVRKRFEKMIEEALPHCWENQSHIVAVIICQFWVHID